MSVLRTFALTALPCVFLIFSAGAGAEEAGAGREVASFSAPNGVKFFVQKKSKISHAKNISAVRKWKFGATKVGRSSLGGVSEVSSRGFCTPESEWNCDDGNDDFRIYDAWFYFGLESGYTARVELERVDSDGFSTCSVTVFNAFGFNEVDCAEVEEFGDLGGMSAGERTTLQQIVDIIVPQITEPPVKLEKCPKISKAGVTATSDKGDGYKAAEAAFMEIYGGALAGVSNLQPVDIKYPDGFTYTFEVLWLKFNPAEVELWNPIINERASKAENKCVD